MPGVNNYLHNRDKYMIIRFNNFDSNDNLHNETMYIISK